MISINNVLHAKCVEPIKRRKGDTSPQWIIHRFTIKGGISIRDAWLRDLCRPNPLLRMLKGKL